MNLTEILVFAALLALLTHSLHQSVDSSLKQPTLVINSAHERRAHFQQLKCATRGNRALSMRCQTPNKEDKQTIFFFRELR
jgi:hypothetical protein